MRTTLRSAAVLAVTGSSIALACTIGGNEGDVCNPLVLRDECQGNLRCTETTCSEYHCCPIDHPSSNASCRVEGCPDAGDEGGGDAEAGAEAATDASSDASGDS